MATSRSEIGDNMALTEAQKFAAAKRRDKALRDAGKDPAVAAAKRARAYAEAQKKKKSKPTPQQQRSEKASKLRKSLTKYSSGLTALNKALSPKKKKKK